MPDVKRYTKLSLIGRVMIIAAIAALLAVGFPLAIFARDRAAASRLPATQDQKQEAGNLTQGTGQGGNKIEPMAQDLRPTILHKEKAEYTEEARRNRLEGKVILDVVFAADEKITDIQVYSGLPDGLTENAKEALTYIRFKPAARDGKPVSVRGRLEFDFKLNGSIADSTSRQGGPASETVEAMSASLRPTITYKEQADYTPEAREKMVEGDVVLNVLFGADSKIKAIRVERGLPYGLTEAAIAAARALRFEPAMKDGKPVNVRGNLEFSFKL
jgi:TonB family protein